jgi:hypothetical protein
MKWSLACFLIVVLYSDLELHSGPFPPHIGHFYGIDFQDGRVARVVSALP